MNMVDLYPLFMKSGVPGREYGQSFFLRMFQGEERLPSGPYQEPVGDHFSLPLEKAGWNRAQIAGLLSIFQYK